MELSSTVTILLLSLTGITMFGLGYYFLIIVPAPVLIELEFDSEFLLEDYTGNVKSSSEDALGQLEKWN